MAENPATRRRGFSLEKAANRLKMGESTTYKLKMET